MNKQLAENYQKRIEEFDSQFQKTKKILVLLSVLRFIFFIAAIVFFVLAVKEFMLLKLALVIV